MICAYTASVRVCVCVCVGGCVCVCVCVRQGELLSVYQESEGPSRLLLHFESGTHTDMNVIGGNYFGLSFRGNGDIVVLLLSVSLTLSPPLSIYSLLLPFARLALCIVVPTHV